MEAGILSGAIVEVKISDFVSVHSAEPSVNLMEQKTEFKLTWIGFLNCVKTKTGTSSMTIAFFQDAAENLLGL